MGCCADRLRFAHQVLAASTEGTIRRTRTGPVRSVVARGVRQMAVGRRLSGLVAEYGKVAVGVHVCNSLTFLSAAVTGVHYGMDVSAVTALLPVRAY